ncbi:MAG: tetratricopeptide repeat protein [Bacteroidota bacterium]
MAAPTSARARALHLVRQGRADLAEPELRRALADTPDDAYLHALLALTLSDLERPQEALPEAERAVGLAPDWAFCHYAHAEALLQLDRPKPAAKAAREALRLDPDDVAAKTTLARALLVQHKLDEALALTDEALALDPGDTNALNVRAMILVRMGRREDAAFLLDGALSQAPNNAVSHANQGWTLLHQNRPREAMEAFREALRLDPDNEWARSGIVEAMKARNVVYRGLLRYFLWLERLSPGKRWGVVIGGYLVAQLHPLLLLIYLPAVFLTWMGDSLFNLVLFADPFGRLVLNRDEEMGAMLVGACLGGGLLAGVGWLLNDTTALGVLGAVLFTLALPVGGTARRRPGKRRWALLYTATLAIVGGGAAAAYAVGDTETGRSLVGFYTIGVIAYTWLGNVFN